MQQIPAKLKIKNTYESYSVYLEEIMENIKSILEKTMKFSSNPTYKKRIKSFDSYYKKLLRLKAKEAATSNDLICLTDMMGIRVICAFLEDIDVAKEQIKKIFDVKEIEVKGSNQNFKEFGYESVHVLVAIPENCMPKNLPENMKIPDDLVCEIQIRTILQDAWAEVEHELIYKTEFTPFDMPLRRKLASINASLSLADIIFQEIRDYQKKLQTEINERRFSFYEKADDLSNSTFTPIAQSEPKNLEKINPYVQGTIDELILQALHAHNSGDLDGAIHIYSEIINSKPSPNNIVLSVILKHRGMAYFSKNDYENALNDFSFSFENDNKNFRSAYYVGIVYSIQNDYENALEWFTKSLQINEYQSHAFYRRAIVYFELKQYENSMNDVIAAQKLGLDDEGLKNLHSKLIEKFDMKV